MYELRHLIIGIIHTIVIFGIIGQGLNIGTGRITFFEGNPFQVFGGSCWLKVGC